MTANATDTPLELVCAPLAPALGIPALTQGTYGQVGNLELAFPDAEDGLWVHWRNLDPTDVRPGAQAGRWSAGLHLADGRRFRAVAAAETAPARQLDLIGSSAGQLLRTTWTAESGFGGVIALGVAGSACSVVQVPGADRLALVALTPDGVIGAELSTADRSLQGERGAVLPGSSEATAVSIGIAMGGELTIAAVIGGDLCLLGREQTPTVLAERVGESCASVPSQDGSAAVLAVDAERGLRLITESADQRFGTSLGRIDAVTACRIERGRRTIGVVARVAHELWWCPPPGEPDEPELIATNAWVETDALPANRRP